MIKTKSSRVKFTELTPELIYMLNNLSFFHSNKMAPQPDDLIITSINDGKHLPNSKHYMNKAIDLRSKNFSSYEQKLVFKNRLQTFLGNEYLVLLEDVGEDNEHFHIQSKE